MKGVLITFCVIFCANIFPFSAMLVRIFTPLPVLFYRSKLGRQKGTMVFFSTVLTASFLFGNNTPGFLTVIGLMLAGLILGELFEKELSIETTLLLTTGCIILCTVLCLLYYSVQAETGIISLISKYIDKNVSSFLYLCKEAGISNEITNILEHQRANIVEFASLLMPSSVIITITFILWINIIAVKPLMSRNGVAYPDHGNLKHWQTPENLIWVLIACGIALLIGNGPIFFLGINGLLIVMVPYFFQGIAITSFYLTKTKLPTLTKIFIYSVISINQFFLLIVVTIGVFDVWFNFRKLESTRSNSPQ